MATLQELEAQVRALKKQVDQLGAEIPRSPGAFLSSQFAPPIQPTSNQVFLWVAARGRVEPTTLAFGTGLPSHAITEAAAHTANNWKVWYSNGSGAVTELALGAAGLALISNGAAAAPSFGSVTSAWLHLGI